MKRFTATALVLLAGFCATSRMQAQSHESRANVPFSFVVGNKLLPAGSYRIFAERDNTIVIMNRDRAIGVLAMLDSSDRKPINDHPYIAFNKYGDHYFLSEIRCSWFEMNGTVGRSKLEKQTRALQASLQPEKVLIQGN